MRDITNQTAPSAAPAASLTLPNALPQRAPLLALLAAQLLSLGGNQITAIALPWFVLSLSGSAAQTGLTAFFGTVPLIIGALFGGVIIDRIGQKRASISADLASALCVAAIPLVQATIGLELWMVFGFVFLGALLDVPGTTARETMLPTVARRAGVPLEQANAWFEAVQGAAMLGGPALAGLLIAWLGPIQGLWVTTASVGLAALLTACFQPARASAEPVDLRGGVVAGLRLVLRDRLLRVITLAGVGLVLFATPIFAVVLPVHLQRSTGSAVELGLVLALDGAGTILGALAYGALARRAGQRRLLLGALLGVSATFVLIAMLPGMWILCGIALLSGICAGPLNPLINTVLQRRTPAALQGRVFGAVTGLTLIATPLGVLLAGYAIEVIGVQPTLIGISAGFVAVTLALFGTPGLRALDEPSGAPDHSGAASEPIA